MTIQFTLLSLYTLLALVGFYTLCKQDKSLTIKNPKLILAVILVVGFAVRTAYGLYGGAFWYDIDCFKAWADCTDYYGLKGLYYADIFLDYPPGYMYILYITDNIRRIFSIDYSGAFYTYLIKLPSIITDLGAVYFIYRLAKKHLSENWALFGAAVYCFAPAVIYNSGVWGQIDSFYTFFIVLALYFASENQTVKAALVYAFALFTKPQALLFGPVLLFYILQRKSLKEFFKAAVTGLGAIWIMVLPFTQGLNPLWLIDQYKETFGGYKYFTVNAYNFFMAMGYNWKSLDSVPGSSAINYFVVLACFALCAWAFFSIKDKGKFFYIGYVFITVFFTFCTMMHERYVYPAFLMCLAAAIVMKNTKMFFLFLAVQGINYLNICAAMLSQYNGLTVTKPLYLSISLAMIAVCLYSLYLMVSLALKDKKLSFSTPKAEYIILAAVTVFYAFFGFFRLGNTQAPQNFYQSEVQDEWFIMRFDSPSQINSAMYFSGLGDQYYPEGSDERKIGSDFDILVEDLDGNWTKAGSISESSVFTWKKLDINLFGQAVMVRANKSGQVLNEIAFLDENGNIIRGTIELSRPSWGSYSPYLAVDESETVPPDTSYYSSMYFDEIYHGRTAYEQLHGYSIYETTHPPLGKVIMELGIAIFGMTPFGWRFMGALCGVLMVPLMYFLAKLLFENTYAAFMSCFLFAFDFMHYAQTRIATVDTYVVLFVMLTFYFMLLYYKEKPHTPLSVQFMHLLLSGIFMGCAIAVKWNGAYPMIGLAIFFFVALYDKYSDAFSPVKAAASAGSAKPDKAQKSNKAASASKAAHRKNSPSGANVSDMGSAEMSAKADAQRKALKTIGFCFIAFVFVPLIVYVASYFQILTWPGLKGKIQELISWQSHMFNYHSALVSDHFFSSPWYSWLYMEKPIWYSIERFADGTVSSFSAFGNPAIWWVIPFAVIITSVVSLKKRDTCGLFIILGYFSSYLPWALISRQAFIYHYFPATVFGVLAIGYVINLIYKKYPKYRRLMMIYPAAAFILFIVFFPVISGFRTTAVYADTLELFGTWYFN